MNEITRILSDLAHGDAAAADQLLPLVYDELRRVAAGQMAREKPGQTLDATALVHEAYVRLVGTDADKHWDGRGHFFAAAAEAMRRILVEAARRKRRLKHGGALQRHPIDALEIAAPAALDPLDILALHEVLERLAVKAPRRAELVKLRYFAGCTIPEAADLLGISASTTEDDWAYAKAWLLREMARGEATDPEEKR